MAMDQYLYIPFLGGWTSINPSYFDVNYRGTIGFDPSPYLNRIMLSVAVWLWFFIDEARKRQECDPTRTSTIKIWNIKKNETQNILYIYYILYIPNISLIYHYCNIYIYIYIYILRWIFDINSSIQCHPIVCPCASGNQPSLQSLLPPEARKLFREAVSAIDLSITHIQMWVLDGLNGFRWV